jgi:hypothetical protein
MNKSESKTELNTAEAKLTAQQLAHLGGQRKFPANARLFCLYNADGSPISISGSREAAVGDAMEHDLIAASVH